MSPTAQATSSGQPTTSQQPGSSQAPGASADPGATAAPQTTGPGSSVPPQTSDPTDPLPTLPPILTTEDPLPEPELETADEIAQLMFDPAWSDQVVVSMLDVLGIGLYETDGTPIRTGTETTGTDFFMYEEEARALIEMLQDLDEEDAWISFRDFHAALAGLGWEGTVEELAQAYAESYAAEPDANISKLVSALAFIDVEASIPRFTAVWMFADAFLEPNANEDATAMVAAGGQFVAQRNRRGLGAARNRVRQRSGLNPQVQAALLVHLLFVVGRSGVSVSAAKTATHEVHNNVASTVDFVATVRSAASQFVNPFPPHNTLIPVQSGGIENVTVTWLPEPSLMRHGQLNITGTTRTDAAGESRATFSVQQERAQGHGVEIQEVGRIKAQVSSADLITQVYGQPSVGALVSGTLLSQPAPLVIEWHEPRVMHIKITNHYEVAINAGIGGETSTKGDDEWDGDLVEQPDGSWRGDVGGSTRGSGRGTTPFGTGGCPWSWDALQLFELTLVPTQPNGPFQMTFTPSSPAAGSLGGRRCRPTRFKLAGILLAPFNDTRITTGAGLQYAIPPDPGVEGQPQQTAYPITSGLSTVTITNTSWKFEVTYKYPDPPTP